MGKGSGTNTVTNNSQPPAVVLNAYADAYNRAQNAVGGPNPVAPLSPLTNDGLAGLTSVYGRAYLPNETSATSYLNQSTAPLYSDVQQYESPYTQDVVNATQAQFNNQNAIQQQGVIGNAVASGAWGGDRSAVAQGIVAGQQQLAQAPVIAGLYNQGYTTALQADEAQRALEQQAGVGLGGLAAQDFNALEANYSNEIAGGQIQQQNNQQQLSLPYSQASYLANIAEGLGAGMGGTSTTTSPGPSVGSQILGTATGIGGLLGATGAFGSAGWLTGWLARGGRVPQFASGGIVPNGAAPNPLDVSVIPTVQFTHAAGIGPPKPPAAYQDPNVGLLTPSGLAKMAKDSGAFGDQGWLKTLFSGPSATPGDFGGGPDDFGGPNDFGSGGGANVFANYGGGGDYRRGGIVPERPEDLRAQFGAMLDPRSAKDSVFVAHRPEGSLFTTHLGKVRHFARGGADDASMAGILGYPETKMQAMASGSPRVVQGISPHGHVVIEMAASPNGEWAARDAAARHVPGGIVRTLPVQAALARRGFARGGIIPGYDIGGDIDYDPAAVVAADAGAEPGVMVSGLPALSATQGVGISYDMLGDLAAPVFDTPAGAPLPTREVAELGSPAHTLATIRQYESGGNYNAGWGGTDLSKAPHDETGFPIWSGKDGPQGISHAAGAYQFEPATWAHYAKQLGITDFSPESQDRVAAAALADQGTAPWAPFNPRLAAALKGGIAPSGDETYGDSTAPAGIVPSAGAGDSGGVGIVPRASSISTADAEKAAKSGDINPWLALAAAGFGIAGGRSPYPLQNIGAGALEGLKFYQGLRTAAPEMRLKNAQADVQEATAGAYKAQQEWTRQGQVDALNANLKALKPGANSPTTAAVPVPGGAVAKLPETPSVAAPTVAAPSTVQPTTTPVTPDQQALYNRLDQQYAQIDHDIARLRTFPAAPGQQMALQQAIIARQAQRVQLQEQDPRVAAAKAAVSAEAQNPALIARAAGVAKAERENKPTELRGPGSTTGTYGPDGQFHPAYVVPTPRTVTNPDTGLKQEEFALPPGAPGAPAGGGPIGQPWVTGISEPTKFQIDTEQEGFKEAKKEFGAAQNVQQRLGMMDHAIDQLNQSGWSSTGTGAQTRLGAARDINSFFTTFGLNPLFDPAKVANWEDLNKETTRAGFELARTLGSREAQMIVQSATAAVPNAENTAMGAKLVSSSLNQAAQRQVDYYQFLNDWGSQHSGRLNGADIAFNQQHPVQGYVNRAIVAAVPPQAVALLKTNPALAGQFDQKYGTGISKFVLGQ